MFSFSLKPYRVGFDKFIKILSFLNRNGNLD